MTKAMTASEGKRAMARAAARRCDGFTLVEVTTSVVVLLIVLTAAWALLTSTNTNLNRIQYGGEASEANRAALDAFQRDINHAVQLQVGASPILVDQPRSCSMAADVNGDGVAELVTWQADDVHHTLVRTVTLATTQTPQTLADFQGTTTTSTVVDGLADTSSDVMFTYATQASDWQAGQNGQAPVPSTVGLVTLRVRNALGPVESQTVIDRSVSCRVTAFVVNAGSSY